MTAKAGVEPVARQAYKPGDGTWRIDAVTIPLPGLWSVRLDITTPDAAVVTLEDQIEIRPWMRRAILVAAAMMTLLAGERLAAQWSAARSGGSFAYAADLLRISVPIKNRALANQVQRFIRVTQGDLLELVFTSDEAAALHLHGYDLHLDVEAGAPAVLQVDAKIAGRFVLEAHRFGKPAGAPGAPAHRHVELLYLEVYPR
jgi:hypothetical protein